MFANVRIFLAIALGGLGAGCDQLQTLFGRATSTTVFHECVERGKKEGVDAATTKNFCINKYQGLIGDRVIEGKAGPAHCVLKDDKANELDNEIKEGLAELKKKGSYTSTEFDAMVRNKTLRIGPRTCDEYEFELKNASKEYVVTLIEFTIQNLQTGSSEIHTFEGQWIEPSKEKLFKVKLSNPFSRANPDEKLEGQHNWKTTTIKGFKMNY